MAIRGDKFLKISKAGFFSIKEHALDRIIEFLRIMSELNDAFELPCEATELIAVIGGGENDGEYEWVTTYAPNHRNESNILWGIHQVTCSA